MRMGRWNLGILLVAGAVIVAGTTSGIAVAHPRQQSDSLAEAARRAQSEKKSGPATQKVWTNEDIPRTPGDISIVGIADTPSVPDSPASATTKPAAAAKSADKSANTEENRATIQSDLAAAKLDLNTATTDLDILTRKQTLDSQSYYGKPDYASDTAGAAQLSDGQAEVDAKKQEVADARKKVDDLQAQLDSLSSDSGASSDSNSSTAPSDSSSSTPSIAPPDSPSGNTSNPTSPSN